MLSPRTEQHLLLPMAQEQPEELPICTVPLLRVSEGRERPLGLEHEVFEKQRKQGWGSSTSTPCVTLGTDFPSLQVISQHLLTAAGISLPFFFLCLRSEHRVLSCRKTKDGIVQ